MNTNFESGPPIAAGDGEGTGRSLVRLGLENGNRDPGRPLTRDFNGKLVEKLCSCGVYCWRVGGEAACNRVGDS